VMGLRQVFFTVCSPVKTLNWLSVLAGPMGL
jgi:hypothetical protein